MRLNPMLHHARVALRRRQTAFTFLVSCLLSLLAAGSASADAVLLEFSSENCPPCRAMQPIVSELIARGVPVRQVDVQSEPQIVRRYQIRSTPTYVVLRNGREVTRLVGAQSVSQLRAALQQTGSGEIVPTRSIQEPQTRLAPLTGNVGGLSASSNRSVRRDEAGREQANNNQWQSLGSLASVETNTGRSGEPSQNIVVEAMPNVTLADAVERAHAATVRLRVYDGRGYGAGTGTIIDVHGEEALVLTCGHLFRDGEGNDKIEVDIFVGGEPKTVMGELIDFDAGDRDIGLVAIRPGMPVEPVRVITASRKMKVGEPAFSFGCDRGDPPSRRDTRITGVNKYNQNIGGSNLEISGAPIDGRSGGGLFDEQGVLVGVCNAADYKSDIGIYTGPGAIHWQLDRARLTRLYDPSAGDALVNNTPAPSRTSETESLPMAPTNQFAGNDSADSMGAGDGPTEMIVILRDSSGNAREQVITLDRPDAQLVQQIRQAARR